MTDEEERVVLLGNGKEPEATRVRLENGRRTRSKESPLLVATPEGNEDIADDSPLPSMSAVPVVVNCAKHTRQEQQSQEPEEMLDTHSEPPCAVDDQHRKNSWKVTAMITITFLFFIVELVVGIMNRSIALLADSYHMLSDVMALVVALVCLKLSRRKSRKNGFGWVRAEVLGALVNGVFLLSMCGTISLEAFGRLLHPQAMQNPIQVLIVGTIGLIINIIGITMFHGIGGHGHSHGGGGHGHSHGGGGGGHGHSHDGAPSSNGHSHKSDKSDSPRKSSDPHLHEIHRARLPNNKTWQGQSLEDADLPPPRVRSERAISQISQLSTGVSHNHLALRLVGMPEESDEEEEESSPPGVSKKERKEVKVAENLNMRGVLLHIIADAVGSVFVIATACCSFFLDEQLPTFNKYLDPLLSLTLVGLISFSAYNLVAQTAGIIMRRPPVTLDMEELKKDIAELSGVVRCHSLEVWTLVGNRHIATAEIEFCTVLAFDQAAAKIRRLFHRNNVHSLTIQPSFSDTCILDPAQDVPTPEPTLNDLGPRHPKPKVVFETGMHHE